MGILIKNYLKYRGLKVLSLQRRTLDSSDDLEWITVNGNHIPIKEGQSKEDAVNEFLKNKPAKSKPKKTNKSNSLIQNDLNDELMASTVSEKDAFLSLEDAGLIWDNLIYDLVLDETEVLKAGQFLNIWQKRDEERYKKSEANFTNEKRMAFRQRMKDAYVDDDLADIICNEKQEAGSLLGGEYGEDYDPMFFDYYIENPDFETFNENYPENSIVSGLQLFTEDFRNRDNPNSKDALDMVNNAIQCAEPQDLPMSRLITADDMPYYGNFQKGQKFDINEPRSFADGSRGISVLMNTYITNESICMLIIEGASKSVNISAISGYVNQGERMVSGSFEITDVYTIMGRQVIKIKQILGE